MVVDIINEIKEAEQQALELVSGARVEAREILGVGERKAKAESARIVETAKSEAQSRAIASSAAARTRAQQKVDKGTLEIAGYTDKARENLGAAVELILSRVV